MESKIYFIYFLKTFNIIRQHRLYVWRRAPSFSLHLRSAWANQTRRSRDHRQLCLPDYRRHWWVIATTTTYPSLADTTRQLQATRRRTPLTDTAASSWTRRSAVPLLPPSAVRNGFIHFISDFLMKRPLGRFTAQLKTFHVYYKTNEDETATPTVDGATGVPVSHGNLGFCLGFQQKSA